MRKGAAAHFGFDVDAQHVTPIDHDGHQPRVQNVDHQQAESSQQGQPQIARRQKHINERLDRQRKGKLKQSRGHRTAKIQPEQGFPGAVVFKELPEHEAHLSSVGGLKVG